MNHPTAWTPPADVANKLQSYWERWQISAVRLGGTPHCFFLDLPLRKPEGLIPKSGDRACTVGYHNERP